MEIDVKGVIKQIMYNNEAIAKSDDKAAKYKIKAYNNLVAFLEAYIVKYGPATTTKKFKEIAKGVITDHMIEKVIDVNKDLAKPKPKHNATKKEKSDIIKAHLMTLSGVGPNNINKIYQSIIEHDDSILSASDKVIPKLVNEFLASDNYTGNQQVKDEAKYRPLKAIPRNVIVEIDAYLEFIRQGLTRDLHKNDEDVKLVITGSYRRRAQTSSDVDVLMLGVTFKDVFNNITQRSGSKINILSIYAEGDKKTSTICGYKCFDGLTYIIVMDFFQATKEDFIYQLLYTTGSKDFNITMRKVAKKKGYTLSQYGLTNLEGKKVELKVENEKDVFDFLGMAYRDPQQRNK
jgi:DNA polymerase/3'-5' exonuclease PolX